VKILRGGLAQRKRKPSKRTSVFDAVWESPVLRPSSTASGKQFLFNIVIADVRIGRFASMMAVCNRTCFTFVAKIRIQDSFG
jgi:hypothetical protein